MSRSKKIARDVRASTTPKAISTGKPRRFRLLAIVIAVVGIGAVIGILESPWPCYLIARQFLSRWPSQSEQWAERAVTKAGGDYPAAQLLQCQALAATGEWDAALGGFALIKSPRSCPPQPLLDLAARALEARQFQLADRAIKAARFPGPSFAQATELLIQLKLQFQLLDEALILCREWQADPANAPLPWAIAAEIETSQFELAAAIADYQEALRRSPPRELEKAIRGSLAKLLVHSGDVTAARVQFDKIQALGPIPPNAQLEYAQVLRMEGRLTEALAEVDRYLTENATNPEALKRRGQIRMDLGQLDEALADLQSAVAGNDLDIATHHLLAQVYLRQGKPDLAQPHLKKSRRLTDAKIRIPELEELIRSDPKNAEWRRELEELTRDLQTNGQSTSKNADVR